MTTFARNRRHHRHALRAGAFLFVAGLILLAIQTRTPDDLPVQKAGVNILMPVVEAGSSASSSIRKTWDGMTAASELADENEALRGQLADMQAERAMLQERIANLERDQLLRQNLPDFAPQTTALRVLSPVMNGSRRELWIGGGEDVGLREGQAVLGPSGLAGIIRTVYARYAIVQLLTDETSKWGGEAAERDETGIVFGTGKQGELHFQLEKTTTEVEEGDIVFTSGMKGSVAPAGIPIGEITEVVVDESGERRAILSPTENGEELRYVYVLNAQQIPWKAP